MIFGPLLVSLVFFTSIVLVIRWSLAHTRLRREAEMQLQLHTRLIEKFGSPKELGEYLQSDAGKAFLTPPPAERAAPFRRILAAAQAGVILAFVGAAIWMLRGSEALGREGVQAATALGGVTLALGLGFIVSAVLAYALSARWGLLNGKGNATGDAR